MREVTLYAGLAVMLMRQQRNVLPIKYLYRKTGPTGDGFAFEPTMRGREDKDYLRSAVYPELIYGMDSKAAAHSRKVGIGNIPASWKLQKKGGTRIGGGQVYTKGKVYHRGQESVGTMPEEFKYTSYEAFTGEKEYTSGPMKGRTMTFKMGRGGITQEPKDAQDLMAGAGSNIPTSKTLAKVQRFIKFQAGKKGKLSRRQISPQGMKARWIRGGGPGGGQHLKNLRVPRGRTNLKSGRYDGDVDKLPKDHIMYHWYKYWENNYEVYLKNQAQRVLISFLKKMQQGEKSKAVPTKPTTGGKLVRPAKGRQTRGKARAAPNFATSTLVKRYSKSRGIVGVVSDETVLNTISDGGLHVIGSATTHSSIEDLFDTLTTNSTNDIAQFMNNVAQVQREINKDPLKRNRVAKDNTVLGFFLGNFLGLVIVGRPGKGKNAPVQLTPTVLMTGRNEAHIIAQSLLRKEKKRIANTNQARITKNAVAAQKNLEVMASEVDALYALIGKNMGAQLSIEGESGAHIPLERDIAIQLKRNVTNAIRGRTIETDAVMRQAVDPRGIDQTSNFMDWYQHWMKESMRLERRIVERQRPRWQKFMKEYVGPKTNKYRGGDIKSYQSAAKTWHSPGYIRPFVMSDVPKDGSMDQQKPF